MGGGGRLGVSLIPGGAAHVLEHRLECVPQPPELSGTLRHRCLEVPIGVRRARPICTRPPVVGPLGCEFARENHDPDSQHTQHADPEPGVSLDSRHDRQAGRGQGYADETGMGHQPVRVSGLVTRRMAEVHVLRHHVGHHADLIQHGDRQEIAQAAAASSLASALPQVKGQAAGSDAGG